MAKKQQVLRDGDTVTVAYPEINKRVMIDANDLTPEIRHLAMLHGLGQKLGDAASGKTADEKFEMASRVKECLLNGEWELTANRDDTALVKEALTRLKPGINLKMISDDKLKEYRSHPKVKTEIARIRLERAEAQADESEDFTL